MGQDQNHLDLPVLLEVGHALDEAGEDAPPEFLRAGFPDERWVDPVAEPVQLGQLLLMELREPALQSGASLEARLPSIPDGMDLDVEEVGEEWLRSLIGLRLTTSSAEIAAEGWDGGLYRAWSHGDDAAVVLSTVWDSHAEASEFAVRMSEWIEGDQFAEVLPVEGERVTVVFASDSDTLSEAKTAVETAP